MSDSCSDSGYLSLSCSVSSVESEESKVSEVEGDIEMVEPYQFEPAVNPPMYINAITLIAHCLS